MTFSMCSSGDSCSFFAEFLPRVGAYQLAFAARDSCKLTVTARSVVWSGPRGGGREEILQWPPHLPDLAPRSYFHRQKPLPAESKPLELRFRCTGPTQPVWAKFEKLLDPPDLPPSLPPSCPVIVKCGFCRHILTKHN